MCGAKLAHLFSLVSLQRNQTDTLATATADERITGSARLRAQRPPAAQLQAIDSLNMVGTLASGLATLRLEGDTATPGASCYYGTNANGVKGWHRLPTRVTG